MNKLIVIVVIVFTVINFIVAMLVMRLASSYRSDLEFVKTLQHTSPTNLPLDMDTLLKTFPVCNDDTIVKEYRVCLVETDLSRRLCRQRILILHECYCEVCDSLFRDKE